MATKYGLGADPLDGLLPTEATQVAPVVASGLKRAARPVKLDAEVVEKARDAVWWLMHHGEPTLTLKSFAERALTELVNRLAAEHNGGEPFPVAGPLPKGGRFLP